jgi:hypothetical protein
VTGTQSAPQLTVTGSATAGTVVLVTLGGQTVEVIAGVDGRWSAAFAGDDLPEDGLHRAEVRFAEADGTVTVMAGPSALVDMTPPDLDLTHGTASTDHVFNASDRADGVELAGTSEPGARVELHIEGLGVPIVTYAGVDGTWAVTVDAGLLPPGDYARNLTITATDPLGNTTTATDSIVIDTIGAVGINGPISGDNMINGAERTAGVTITGTSEPGTQTVTVRLGGATQSAMVNPDGTWSVTFAQCDIPQGEYCATVHVTAVDRAGNVATDQRMVRVDTRVSGLSVDPVTGDDFVTGAENATGVTITGKTEAGAREVRVRIEGIDRVATVAPDGTWSVTFAPGDLPHGEYVTSLAVTTTDAAGNRATVVAPVEVDTVGPTAAMLGAVLATTDGIAGIGVEGAEHLTVHQIGADGSSAELGLTQNGCLPLQTFDSPVPDGSYLVLSNADSHGNTTDTLVLASMQGGQTVMLNVEGLGAFDIHAIDLQFAPDANLVVTEEQLLALSSETNALVVHGGADDTVTATGAMRTGEQMDIGGQSYSVWMLGDQGSLIIDDDIHVIT